MLGFSKQRRRDKQLIAAADKGNAIAIEAALNEGADIEALNGGMSHLSPLGRAIIAESYDAVEVLLRRGANIEHRALHGDTPLCFALAMKNIALVEKLLDAGASTLVRGFRGRTPLTLAQELGNTALVQRIMQQGMPAAAPDADEVTFTRALGNRTLEEIFNFRAQERISLIRLGEQGPVEAMTRDSFAALGDREQLAKAYVQYKTAGGRVDLPEIFKQPGGVG